MARSAASQAVNHADVQNGASRPATAPSGLDFTKGPKIGWACALIGLVATLVRLYELGRSQLLV